MCVASLLLQRAHCDICREVSGNGSGQHELPYRSLVAVALLSNSSSADILPPLAPHRLLLLALPTSSDSQWTHCYIMPEIPPYSLVYVASSLLSAKLLDYLNEPPIFPRRIKTTFGLSASPNFLFLASSPGSQTRQRQAKALSERHWEGEDE